MYLYKRGKVWWCEATVDGQRHRFSTKQNDKAAATKVAASMLEAAEMTGDPDPHKAVRNTAPAKLIEQYRQHLEATGRSAAHVVKNVRACTRVLEPFATMKAVRPHLIQTRLHDLATERGWSANTTNGERLAVSGFFGWLVKAGRWPSNPAQQIDTVKVRDKQQRRALTDDEIGKLLDAAPLRRRVVYALAVSTGLRRSEIWNHKRQDGLHRDAVDLERGTVSVRASTTKNARDAHLPIGADVSALVAQHLADDPAPFPFRPPTVPTMRADLEAAGIDLDPARGVLDFHALRHTFATRLARAGVNTQQAQRLMRHSTPTLTAEVYTHLVDDDLRAAAGFLSLPGGASVGESVGSNGSQGAQQDAAHPTVDRDPEAAQDAAEWPEDPETACCLEPEESAVCGGSDSFKIRLG